MIFNWWSSVSLPYNYRSAANVRSERHITFHYQDFLKLFRTESTAIYVSQVFYDLETVLDARHGNPKC